MSELTFMLAGVALWLSAGCFVIYLFFLPGSRDDAPEPYTLFDYVVVCLSLVLWPVLFFMPDNKREGEDE